MIVANDSRFLYTKDTGFVTNNDVDTQVRMSVNFVGTEGWIYVDRNNTFEAEPKSILTSVIGPDEVHLYRSINHYGNFIDCVRKRELTVAPVEIAQRSITIGHLGNIAMKLERKVRWDPERERFVNDPEADRMLSRAMRSPWRL